MDCGFNHSKNSWCSQCGHVIVYLAFFGFGTFIIVPHITHWCLIVSGALGLVSSFNVRPTSVDQPTWSVYESVFFIFELFKDRRILRFFFLRLPGGAFLVAMGDGECHCIQSLRLNYHSSTVDSPLIGVCTVWPLDSNSSTRGGLAWFGSVW